MVMCGTVLSRPADRDRGDVGRGRSPFELLHAILETYRCGWVGDLGVTTFHLQLFDGLLG